MPSSKVFMGALLASSLLVITTASCKREEKFGTLAQNLAFPVDVQTSPSGENFYVLSADFDRRYNSGSILVVSEDGEKVSSVQVPRLGRGMALNSKHLVTWYSPGDEAATSSLQFFDITDETQPALVKEFSFVDDTGNDVGRPLAVVLPKDPSTFPYFAMTNDAGGIFIGEYDSASKPAALHRVRTYSGTARGALFLDEVNSVLLAFSTDAREQSQTDRIVADILRYDPETKEIVQESNEIPDDFEDNEARRRSTTGARQLYQVAIYNIAKGKEEGFLNKTRDFETRYDFEDELKSVYFTLRDQDFTWDTDVDVTDKTAKHFRTNFSYAIPHPRESNVFYLSHRGKKSDDSAYSNNVIKVTIKGNIADVSEETESSTLFEYERVFGFSSELDPDNHFPGKIKIVQLGGIDVLLVNHFKDLVNFGAEASFGLSVKSLQGFEWHDDVRSSAQDTSFFQFDANSNGKVLATSVYGNALLPLQIVPGVGLKQGWGELKVIR